MTPPRGEGGFLTEADRARIGAFGAPVYFSASTLTRFVGLSMQSYDGRIDVVEAAYVNVSDSASATEQPSVWTWRDTGLDPADSLRIHACTHLINARPSFRAGAWIPTTAEMDALGTEIAASALSLASVPRGAVTLNGQRTTLHAWEFTIIRAAGALVTIAGRPGFAQAGLRTI
jgi:hypothetical protein